MKLAAALLLFVVSTAEAAEWTNVERVVAIGDVHGAYAELERLLQRGGIIDAAGSWSGGTTHLVSLGDLLDRGPDSRRVMDLLMALQPQADAAGGRVHVVLGNHELMNLTADLRDVSEAEFAAFGGRDGHREAFAPEGTYGAWLLSLPVAVRIDDSLFLHGGVSSTFGSLAPVNAGVAARLREVVTTGRRLRQEDRIPPEVSFLEAADDASLELPETFSTAAADPMFGPNGPFWYRGNAGCHPLVEAEPLAASLARLGVSRVVVGHTPTPEREVVRRLDGLVYVIDTGMLGAVYRGNPRAIEIVDGDVAAFGPDGAAPIVEDTLTTTPPQREEGMSERHHKRAVAAFELDRIIGTGVVRGAEDSGRIITERERQERNLARPQYCETANDYDLLAVFDSLIGMSGRSRDNLAYAATTWRIVALENHAAFPTSGRLPAYSHTPRIAPALARRLEALTLESLSALLGDLLKQRQIKGILRRRDAILTWPRQE